MGDMNAKVKKAVVCCEDRKVHYTVDILARLSEPNIAAFTKGLTPSQEAYQAQRSRHEQSNNDRRL